MPDTFPVGSTPTWGYPSLLFSDIGRTRLGLPKWTVAAIETPVPGCHFPDSEGQGRALIPIN